MQAPNSVHAVAHTAMNPRPTKAPSAAPPAVGALSIKVYYHRDRAHWAIFEDAFARLLFPRTSSGYMRAAGLLDEMRQVFSSQGREEGEPLYCSECMRLCGYLFADSCCWRCTGVGA